MSKHVVLDEYWPDGVSSTIGVFDCVDAAKEAGKIVRKGNAAGAEISVWDNTTLVEHYVRTDDDGPWHKTFPKEEA